MRVALAGLILALLVPTLARAHTHNADINSAFSIGNGGSTVKGFHQTFAIELPWMDRTFAIVPADVSVQFGPQLTQVAYLFGPRATLGRDDDRTHVHLQALVGVVHTNDVAARSSDRDGAVLLGVGLERALRGDYRWATRAQFDRVKRFGDRDDWFTRFSVGLTYRWTRDQ